MVGLHLHNKLHQFQQPMMTCPSKLLRHMP
jgi:hypothetical protein